MVCNSNYTIITVAISTYICTLLRNVTLHLHRPVLDASEAPDMILAPGLISCLVAGAFKETLDVELDTPSALSYGLLWQHKANSTLVNCELDVRRIMYSTRENSFFCFLLHLFIYCVFYLRFCMRSTLDDEVDAFNRTKSPRR